MQFVLHKAYLKILDKIENILFQALYINDLRCKPYCNIRKTTPLNFIRTYFSGRGVWADDDVLSVLSLPSDWSAFSFNTSSNTSGAILPTLEVLFVGSENDKSRNINEEKYSRLKR